MSPSAGRVLVVDDDENNRDMLSRRLQRRGFDVSVAPDGFVALESIAREPFDLVLLDVEMPGMSGFDVLRRVRLEHPATRLPVIIATARTDREDVIEALGLGANDYVTKPLDFAIVAARIETQLSHKRAVDRIVALEDDLRRRNLDLERHNTRMRRSLDMAASMQHALLPAEPTEIAGLKFAWIFQPCDELGGDILNIVPIGSDHVAMYLLDVSGHGVPAALLSVTLNRMLMPIPDRSSLIARSGPNGLEPRSPREVVHELNQRFQMDSKHGQYFTLFYGVMNLPRRQLRYVSAGHPPCVFVPAQGDPRFGDAEGFAVGWFADAEFDEYVLNFGPGDRLFIYSDGIIETFGADSDPFGRDRLSTTLAESRGRSLDEGLGRMVQAVAAFRGSGAVLDDISALAIETVPE